MIRAITITPHSDKTFTVSDGITGLRVNSHEAALLVLNNALIDRRWTTGLVNQDLVDGVIFHTHPAEPFDEVCPGECAE